MNAANSSSHEADQRSYSESEGDRKTREEAPSEISQISTDPTSQMERSPATSRYGRAVKLKSPKTLDEDSRKTGTIPKLRRSSQLHQAVVGEKDKIVEEDQAKSPKAENEVLDDSQVSEEQVLPKIKETPQCHWLVGQLAWAHVGNYPYWPCVVTLDPTSYLHTKLRAVAKTFTALVHVHYFGDNGRHGWVSQTAMIPFIGLADFQKRAESANLEGKKRHALRFHVKPSTHTKWAIAVDEATELLPLSNAERGEHFTPKIERSSYEKLLELATNEGNSKRERLSDSAGPNPKRLKREIASPASEPGEEVEKKKSHKVVSDDDEKICVNLNNETPPTPPSSHKDSSDESSVSRRAKVKKRKKYLDGAFELYYERNRDMIEDAQPDATEDEIRTYLEKTWMNMNLTLRSKYRSRIEPDSNVLSKEGSTDHEEEESSVDSDSKEKDTKKTKVNKVEKDEIRVSDTIKKTRPYNLFRGTKQERVCQICERTGDLTRCKGPCFSYFHLSCVKPGESSSEYSMDEDTMDDVLFQDLKEIKERSANDTADDDDKRDDVLDDKNFKCIDCLSGVAPACFICNDREEDRIRCSVLACGKHYHVSCLKTLPQAQWQGDRLTCPYHTCHTCTSDNPLNGNTRAANERLVRCVRCPSTYHASTSCVPAGSEILTGSQLICPKHYKAPGPPINATWCFSCTRGGSLICCDTCPMSFHAQCLGIDAPDGAFICEDCETGRMPLYGEVVWVKLGKYRWWPSRICFPHEVPQNLEAMSHSPGEFCVMFLGTNNYYWVHRGRAFLYQEGDANVKPSLSRKNVDEAYKKAMLEANEIHERLQIQRVAAKVSESRVLKPPPYVKLKVNKPVGNVKPMEVESIVACDCDADWDNPCAPDTDCLNRILSVECSPDICPAGPKCNNQAFVRRQYPAMEPFHTVERGWGLRTLEPINDGQFVIEYVGEVIDETEYKRRLQHKKELKNENFYFLTIDTCRMIDAEPKGNLSRFMNHSCQPNCETQKWTVNGDTRIGLFALRDIDVGEELTFNYNLASDGEEKKPCLCGAPNCSGFIGLKVQKQKTEKVKRQRRSRRMLKCCWGCGEVLRKSDDYIECIQKTCLKMYHKHCVSFQDEESKFSCPWHYCTECSRRTGSHCTFCSKAYCQAHLDGNLKEYKDKGGYVCKLHEDMDSQKFLAEENEKEESENEVETDKECSSIISDGATFTEKRTLMPRESSPRVSIIEVQLSSEEGEESQKEDSMNMMEYIDDAETNEISRDSRKYSYERSSRRKRRQEERIKTLRSLTPSELEIIIGGSITNTEK